MGMLLVAGASAQSRLPELAQHLSYAERCLVMGHWEGLRASVETLAPERITYYFDGSLNAQQKTAVLNAQAQWGELLDVRFEPVSDPESAHLTYIGVRTLAENQRPAAGYTFWKRGVSSDYRSVLSARVLLATEAFGRTLSDGALIHAALHEIGHLLGLDDSSRRGQVMGPVDLNRPVRRPADSEVRLLRDLRAEALLLRAQARRTR